MNSLQLVVTKVDTAQVGRDVGPGNNFPGQAVIMLQDGLELHPRPC